MHLSRYLQCCGISSLDKLSDGITIRSLARRLSLQRWQAYIVFSDIKRRTGDYTYAKRLIKIIEKHDLGTLTTLPARKNPNSRNTLKVWLWGINQKNLQRFIERNR